MQLCLSRLVGVPFHNLLDASCQINNPRSALPVTLVIIREGRLLTFLLPPRERSVSFAQPGSFERLLDAIEKPHFKPLWASGIPLRPKFGQFILDSGGHRFEYLRLQLVTNKISVSLRKTIIARLSLGAVRILGGTFAVREKRSNGEFLAKLREGERDLEEALVKDQISEDDARGENLCVRSVAKWKA